MFQRIKFLKINYKKLYNFIQFELCNKVYSYQNDHVSFLGFYISIVKIQLNLNLVELVFST